MIGACGVSGGLLSEAGSRAASANARPITPSFHNEKDSNGQQFVDFNPAGKLLAADTDTDLFLNYTLSLQTSSSTNPRLSLRTAASD